MVGADGLHAARNNSGDRLMAPTPDWLLPLTFISLMILLTGLVIGVAKNRMLSITHPGLKAMLIGAGVGALIVIGLLIGKIIF